MQSESKVSIGVPVYNGADYLSDALDSIIGQTHRNLEVVISDNASTDDTRTICEQYEKLDSRIRYFRSPENMGAAWNYNNVFELATGTYFKWAAHDDLIDSRFIELCVNPFEIGGTEISLVYPKSDYVDGDGNFVRLGKRTIALDSDSPMRRGCRVLYHINMANPVFGVFRSSILSKSRLIGSFVASDYVLLFEIALLGKIVELPEVLFHRRDHPQTSRQANVEEADVHTWFDPRSRQWKGISTRQRLWLEYLRSVWRFTHSPYQATATSLAVTATVVFKRFKVVGGRLKRKLGIKSKLLPPWDSPAL